MRHAVIVEAVRNPIGRAHPEKGYYRDVRADDLSADLMKALLERASANSTHSMTGERCGVLLTATATLSERKSNRATRWEPLPSRLLFSRFVSTNPETRRFCWT